MERLEALSDPSDELIELAKILRRIAKEIDVDVDLDPDENKGRYTYVQDSDEEEDEEIVCILNDSNM